LQYDGALHDLTLFLWPSETKGHSKEPTLNFLEVAGIQKEKYFYRKEKSPHLCRCV